MVSYEQDGLLDRGLVASNLSGGRCEVSDDDLKTNIQYRQNLEIVRAS